MTEIINSIENSIEKMSVINLEDMENNSMSWGDVIRLGAIKNNEYFEKHNIQMTYEKLIEMKSQIKNTKCNRCKTYRSELDFFNPNGRKMKTCNRCRVICNRNVKKYKLKKKQLQTAVVN